MTTRAVLAVYEEYDNQKGMRELECPRCHQTTGLHLDSVVFGGAGGMTVQVNAGGEDSGALPEVHVTKTRNSAAGQRAELQLSNARRHYIKLLGWCEHCGPEPFGLMFQQHKGMTYFDLTDEPEEGSRSTLDLS